MANLPIPGISIYLWRQIFVSFVSCLIFILNGLTIGHTGVLLLQLRNDEDFAYDKSFDSWIASISPLAMIPACFISGIMTDSLGRKTAIIILLLPYTLGWFCMAFANDNVMMLIGRFIIGICTGALRPAVTAYIAEIIPPKYRAPTFLCLTFSMYFGTFTSHTLGICFYWRTSCLIFGLPNIVICFIIIMYFKESPLWLISKGNVEIGAEYFKIFRGAGVAAEEELATVLESRKQKPEKMTMKFFMQTILSKAFMKTMLTIFILFCATQLCGVNVMSYYAQDIYSKTFSGGINPFKLMLAVDGIRIGTAASVCLLSNILPRKRFYLLSGFGTGFCLVVLAVYLYIHPVGLMWLAVTLMAMYMTAATALSSLSWSYIGEIFPGNVRGFGSGLSSSISFILLFIAVKITPGVMVTFGETVMYAGFGVVSIISSVLLYFMLPDTNGKTLQDIEDTLYKTENNAIPERPESKSISNML